MPDIALSTRAEGRSKPLDWIGSSFDDFRAFPAPVQRVMGFALRQAQEGRKHPDAKPLRGFGGATALEIVENHDGSTYRAVYSVRFAEVVYVLHAFQKKARKGIKHQGSRSSWSSSGSVLRSRSTTPGRKQKEQDERESSLHTRGWEHLCRARFARCRGTAGQD